MKKKTRIRIPKELEQAILYKSARTCCICRNPKNSVQIHHIDQNPSNNKESNLVAICGRCHDEAHTHHQLSKNLTANSLKKSKQSWEAEVSSRASAAMIPRSNFNHATWSFINHQRIPEILKALGEHFDPTMLRSLKLYGIVDSSGIPILKTLKSPHGLVTIYDRLEWDDALRFHEFYVDAVNRIIKKSNPIELGAIWRASDMKALIKPGQICFCLRGFRFKKFKTTKFEETRFVYARAKKIEIRFLANTRHMFGNSALYTTFNGHSFIAALLLVKNVSTKNGLLIIDTTPLALGTGFVPYEYETPYILRYGWTKSVTQLQ